MNTVEAAKEYLESNLGELIVSKSLDEVEVELLSYALQRYAEKQCELPSIKKSIIEAWESLPEGYYGPKIMEAWLVGKMKPVIDKLRGL